MTEVFDWFGVDYRQWKAMSRTLLRADFRLPLSGASSVPARLGDLAAMIALFGFYGLGAAVVVASTPDVLVSGTVTLAYLSVMLVTTLLSQHSTTLLSAADYVILGSRPVSSRTFLAIRATNVLFHAGLITTLMAYPPVIAYTVLHGVSIIRGVAATAAIYLWGLALTLLLVVSYTGLLHALGADRFRRIIGYLQVVAGILAYGGIFLVSAYFLEAEGMLSLPDALWITLLPPAWYASLLELATGSTNSTTTLRFVLGVGFLASMIVALRGRLGLAYAAAVAAFSISSETSSPVMRTPLFSRGEPRAVAILVRSHFRHDLRVRLGILAIIPVMLFYLVLGTVQAPFDLVALSVLLLPALLSQHFSSSDAHHASWMYGVSPADGARLVIALKNIAVTYFLMPLLLFVAAVFVWRFGDTSRAFVHTIILGMLSHLALQMAIIISPRLPFALPPDKTRGTASMLLWMVVVIFGGQAALAALDGWVYATTGRTAATVAALALASWILNRVLRWRARLIPS